MNTFSIILIVCFIILAGLLIYMYIEANENRVVKQRLEFPNLSKDFGVVNIFFISDIHRRVISDEIIDQVKEEKVDVVIIGGDLLEKGVRLEQVKENILKLKGLGPVLFVWGNNDYEIDVPLLDALLLNLNVKTLVNTSILFESENGARLSIIGVDDPTTERDDLEQAMLESDENSFKILVSHNPIISKSVLSKHKISLILSGHTHGGQIHLLGYSPYEKGKIKKENDVTILISNGYGTTGVPLRLGAKPETHLLSIKNPEVR